MQIISMECHEVRTYSDNQGIQNLNATEIQEMR